MPDRLAIGVDIGGTKVTAGVVDEHGRLREVRRRETPTTSSTAVADVVAELVADLRVRHDVALVGVGAAGFVDATHSTVLFAPHLAWRNEPLQDAIGGRVGLPVMVENDANAAAWAEWRFGAAQGEDAVVGITLGTGIGGGIVLRGRLYRGRFGTAGEFGHMQVVPGGRRCECGNDGCWEQYASGNALAREARELAAAGSPLGSRLVALAGGDATAITGPLVTQAAQRGDRAAVDLLARIGHWLGVGLANVAAALDPGIFVVGGGLSEAGELLIGPARTAFAETLTGRGFRPQARVVPARLGNDAGMIGAATLALALLDSPHPPGPDD
jgi:glucokinase